MDYRHPDLAPNMWVNGGEIPGNGIDDDGNGAAGRQTSMLGEQQQTDYMTHLSAGACSHVLMACQATKESQRHAQVTSMTFTGTIFWPTLETPWTTMATARTLPE